MQERWTAVERYLTDLLVPPDATLDAVLEASAAAGLPRHHITPGMGKLLYLLARMIGARRVLEIGTLGGYSAIWMARALPEDGRLITLEGDPRHAEIACGNIARAGLADVIEVRLGRALDTLQRLAEEDDGPFDLTFIDADKPSNVDYFEGALKLSRPGSVIVVDNVVYGGEVIDSEIDDASLEGVRRLNERLGAEPRVSATAIQTVGSKGYDGFAIALVTGDA
jgi:predicted O-methyltransferase YrrM